MLTLETVQMFMWMANHRIKGLEKDMHDLRIEHDLTGQQKCMREINTLKMVGKCLDHQVAVFTVMGACPDCGCAWNSIHFESCAWHMAEIKRDPGLNLWYSIMPGFIDMIKYLLQPMVEQASSIIHDNARGLIKDEETIARLFQLISRGE